MSDQATSLRALAYRERKVPRNNLRIISVTSGKGGVGKTNFTVNLAIALAEYGYRVIIFDGDLGLANVDVACGIAPRYTMAHLLTGEKTLEEIIVEGPMGIGILPGGSGALELANLDKARLTALIANLRRLENLADILLIDTGAGLNHNVLHFLLASDDIILLTTPEPTALTDAYGLLKTLHHYSDKVSVNVVVNRVTAEAEAKATYERLETAARKFLRYSLTYWGWIYEDSAVRRAVMQQEPLGVVYPNSSAYRCIKWIAGTVSGTYLRPPRQSAGIRGFLAALLKIV